MSICRRLKRGEKVNWSPFCDCGGNIERHSVLECSCGEEQEGWVEWAWDPGDPGAAVTNPHGTAFIGRGFGRPPSLGSPILLMSDNRQVMFHPSYSSGTAAVRGQHPLEPGMHHYWEVKILTSLYGTDMMVGVGTAAVDLHKDRFKYVSLLGEDNESWGYSYNGNLQHGGKKTYNGYPFGLGSIIGVHVDLWHGKLEFFLNRKPLGIAFSNLHGKTLYPMASSTAAKSGMRLIHASSHPHSLLLSCTRALGIASEAALYENHPSRPSKRHCVDVGGTDVVWGSGAPKGGGPAARDEVPGTKRGGGAATTEVLSCRSLSKVLDGSSCAAVPPIGSPKGTFCISNNLGDGALAKGLLYSKNCDRMPCTHLLGGGSNSESSHLVCRNCGYSESVVGDKKTVMPSGKSHQSAHWLRASPNVEQCSAKETHAHHNADTSSPSSVDVADASLPKSKGGSSSAEVVRSREEPLNLLSWLQQQEEKVEPAPKLDIMVCTRKRKQRPGCNFVECIWSIPGLRAKVECSFWWLLGTRKGKGVLVASGDPSPAYPSLIIVDEDEEWARRGEIVGSSQVHHPAPGDSSSRRCHERLCLLCHPVI
ncbi:uncharacterized protein LOC124169083 [Ischnura elegans]|uniref:uncharacterized protein LOC124169083 n=1 Tax=Ischnura elegans TaxID=197161 RepID=UPI001ED86904|nr:uncharacterized protein LOC124169083 [Ischnura elegans]